VGGLRAQQVLLVGAGSAALLAGAVVATPLVLGALRNQPWETQPGA
jgi:hypothetical protein